jgi:hypothetical protein
MSWQLRNAHAIDALDALSLTRKDGAITLKTQWLVQVCCQENSIRWLKVTRNSPNKAPRLVIVLLLTLVSEKSKKTRFTLIWV